MPRSRRIEDVVCVCPVSYDTADLGFDFVSYDCWVFGVESVAVYYTVHFLSLSVWVEKLSLLMSVVSNVAHCRG